MVITRIFTGLGPLIYCYLVSNCLINWPFIGGVEWAFRRLYTKIPKEFKIFHKFNVFANLVPYMTLYAFYTLDLVIYYLIHKENV